MESNRIPFAHFLRTAFDKGEYTTDDIIAFVLPLFRKVLGFHEAGWVGAFENEEALFVSGTILDMDESRAHAPIPAPYSIEAHPSPGYLPGYRSFEQELGHHDPQTDIFCLGLILGSMAMGLDLYDPEKLAVFVRQRVQPSLHFPRIHPTLGRLITEMTELDRSRRSQDLYDVITRLEHYRHYDPEKQTDLSQLPGWIDKELKEREALILNRLRNRLFDVSRRNRLLYYKPNMRFVNLTVSSVPLVLHTESIRPEGLFCWNAEIAGEIRGMKEIVLNKYLRFGDHGYLPASLDMVRVESQRNIQEYGFSQLRLVIAFLNWHNLKEDAKERIQSPLLLIPVSLKRNRKVKEDYYVLKVLDNAAEVNPVLAGQLRELYGIRLPDFVDLDEMSPEQFYRIVQAQIEEVNQGIVLRCLDSPSLPRLQYQAAQTVNQYRKRSGAPPLAEPAAPSAPPADAHTWEFDLCHMVLGNFNYKKMSLVRDYNTVIDRQVQHVSFDALFSKEPRSFAEHPFDGNRADDWFHVVTADPTQTRAILQSRAGYSYIIQGPPGTGKSQTITNLIADFVARGKNVLFVCEKRAALDVVFHRLKQVGLEELCCYIHDSQGDKREFIRNCKTTYEDFIDQRPDLNALKTRREALLHGMNRSLDLIREFHEAANMEAKDAGLTIRALIDTVIGLRTELVPLSPQEEESLPSYIEWKEAAPRLAELEAVMEDTGADPVFAQHPFSRVQESLFLADAPQQALEEALQHALKALEEVAAALDACPVDPLYRQEADRLKSLVQFAVLLYPLATTGQLSLADAARPQSRELQRLFDEHRQQQEALAAIREKNIHWRHKLPPEEVDAALLLAIRQEGAFLSLLNSAWRRLKHRLRECYDFTAHTAVQPSNRQLLEQLKTEYDAAALVEQTRRLFGQRYPFGQNIDTARLSIDLLQSKKGHPDLQYLLLHHDAAAVITSLQALHQPLSRLETRLSRSLQEPPAGSLAETKDELLSIQLNADGLRDWLPALRAFTGAPEPVKRVLRRLPLRIKQAGAVIARKTLQEQYALHRGFAHTDALSLEKSVTQLGDGYTALLKLNAELIRAYVRQRFLHQAQSAARPASQLDEEQKQFKKVFSEGRKILENEFGKSMRYKSIRELSEKESGVVLRSIKPVWLMSPYSVSDSLPLDDEHFDVVIYDEASQITLEEGVPALYRGRQTIIVGDEKQMPPTDFFNSRVEDPDDLDTSGEAEEWLADDADSLLAQGARKLESTLLSWHYRSHFETLISFSNHAFYAGELLTIPDKAIHHQQKTPIRVSQPEDAAIGVEPLFNRSISFHLLTNGVYEKRSNPGEAAYIARLVRELLRRRTEESIGIVAFSQEQQHAIENALEELGWGDTEFAQLLEEAVNRTENDQFTGLIIKNLENIQGDERDIIIMSVCYGPDARGRIVMNFGPINKKGGEKRLNVLFSRARRHMAVVSSIRYEQITNEYNEGANYLRRFLQYAEEVSEGRMDMARTILEGLVLPTQSGASRLTPALIRDQLKEQLSRLGYTVDGPIGQSGFKCSLAVKLRPEDEEYALAILIDDEEHYRNRNLIEQYYQRPAVLRNFGWTVLPIFAKDWLHQPQAVLDRLQKALRGETLTPEAGPASPYDRLAFRRLVRQEPGGAGAFWEGATDGNKLILRWGKEGTRGQTRLRTLDDEESARKELDRLEGEQKEMGFRSAQEPR